MMGLLYQKLHRKSNLLLVSTEHDYTINHAVVSYNNKQVDNNGESVNYQILQTIAFDDLPYWMKRAY
jgi:hypothetical protein